MRWLAFLLILFLVSPCQVDAQCYKIDSLSRVLRVLPREDTIRVDALNQLSEEYLINNREKNAEYFSMQALNLAQKIEYKIGEADAHYLLGKVYFLDDLKRDQESIEEYQKALEIYQSEGNTTKMALTLKTIGKYYYDLFYIRDDYYSIALEYYLKYLKLAEKTGETAQMAEASVMVGTIYEHLGEEVKSNAYFLKAVQMREQVDEKEMDDPHLFSKAKQIYDLQIANQKFFNYALIVGLVLAVLLVTLLLIVVMQKRRDNILLKKQYSEIEQQKYKIMLQNEVLEQQKLEIEEQKDKLSEQYQQLTDTKQKLEVTNKKLNQSNIYLEEKVTERTLDLSHANHALIQANEELDLIVYRASHDFKGPVATLIGLAHVARLECAEESPKSVVFFQRIEDTALKMDRMLEKLHQVSYIMGKTVETKMLNIEEIISQVEDNLSEKITQSHLQLITDIEPASFFYADTDLLIFILENLVENATTFRSEDSSVQPTLSIKVYSTDTHLVIYLRDNGAGIPHSYFSKIFDMFFRGSEASEGNGLGLYVVKKALDRMQGEVTVESQEGEFTSFSIQLPK
jgi:signal transduction histidine kinase